MNFRICLLVVFAAALMILLDSASAVQKSQDLEELSTAEFKRLHAELEPKNETWKSIPWSVSLRDAQNRAIEQGKPLFIWAMDGNPLGCT